MKSYISRNIKVRLMLSMPSLGNNLVSFNKHLTTKSRKARVVGSGSATDWRKNFNKT